MLRFKRASALDSSLIASLIRRCFLEQAEVLGIAEEDYPNYVAFETEAGVRRRITSGTQVALAYLGGEVVGTISSLLPRGGSQVGEITRLAVLSIHRGAGYGRDLMTHAEGQLRANGAMAAELSIVAEFHRLQAFYEAQGYSVRESRQPVNLPFALLFMQKSLASKNDG